MSDADRKRDVPVAKEPVPRAGVAGTCCFLRLVECVALPAGSISDRAPNAMLMVSLAR